MHEEVVDLVVEVLLFERDEVLASTRSLHLILHTSLVITSLEFLYLNPRPTFGEDLLRCRSKKSSNLSVSNV